MAIPIIIFVVVFACIVSVVALSTSYFKSKQKQQIRAMLRNAEASPAEQRSGLLLKENPEDNSLADILSRFSFAERLDLIIEQSGQKTTSAKLVIFSFSALLFIVQMKKLRVV